MTLASHNHLIQDAIYQVCIVTNITLTYSVAELLH